MSLYYQGNNNQQSKENNKKPKDVLERDWKDRIHDGQFIVYTYAEQNGEKAVGANAVHTILQTIVLTRFRHVFDFTKNLTETQLKLTQTKQVARYGIDNADVKGLIAGCEKSVLAKVWNRAEYWDTPELSNEHIVIIKKDIDKMIGAAFKDTGKIAIGDIWDYLEDTYGFSPCNMSAFVFGFLLKEYSRDPYRSMNAEGHRDSMAPEKLSEMIGNYIGKSNAKPTYIVSLTDEEKAFYELTESAWGITPNSCTSPNHAGSLILSKMREFAYPVWCLEDVDTNGVYDLVKMYMELVQNTGDKQHDIANNIGKIAMQRPSSADNLKSLLTVDNCIKGMKIFLERFESGKLLNIAKEIGAIDSVLGDIKKLFSVQYSALWIGTTGEDEIRKLTVEYSVVKSTNLLLNVSAHSKDGAFKQWRETLKFLGISCEAVRTKRPALDKFFYHLLKIVNLEDMLPENMRSFLDEITNHSTEIREIIGNTLGLFVELYEPYLEGFSLKECEDIKNSITADMFVLSSTQSKGLSVHIDIGRAELPSLTEYNKGFFENWDGIGKYKEEALDDIKHNDKGGFFFTSCEDPIHLESEIAVIEKAVNFAATKLAMRECKSFVIASDHGASRLAVIKHQEEKYNTETGGEHSGRCCKVFEGCDLTNCVEEKGYYILTDYGRFKGSRAANVEVHGGASLEEVLVPIITLKLKKQTAVDIRVLNGDNIQADRKKGTTVQIYISDVDNPQNISIVIGNTKYKAIGDDSAHYTVLLEDIKRSKTCKADVYDGDNLLGNVEFKIKGKSGNVDSKFDSEFGDF